jgi:glycosyltransferase involved in cell wall biosynthesis
MENNEIIISVVVPVYNTSQYLDECIGSIVNQTLKEIEIICVNDASTDNSLEVLESWMQKDPRITVVDFKVNKRQGAARNAAIKLARGQYIGMIDSDDYITEDMYQTLLDNTDNYTADIVVGNLYATHSDSDVLERNFNAVMTDIIDIKKSVLLNRCRMVTNIIKKELFDKYDLWYPEGLTYEDNANVAPLFLVANKINICYNDNPFYFYRINNQSTVRAMNNPSCWDRLITAEMFVDHTKRLNQYDFFSEEIDYTYYKLVIVSSFMFALFSFSKYQYTKVKEIIAQYDREVGLNIIKNNKYYKEDKSLQKRIAVLMCHCPLVGYIFWTYHKFKKGL